MSKAQLISGATVSYAVGAETEPTVWVLLKDIITDLPEMFSKPDTVDTTTVDNISQTNIAGMTGGDSLDFGVLLNSDLYTAHEAMLASQNGAQGAPWFKIEYLAPVSRKMTWRGTVANNVTQKGGKGADVLAGTLSVYPATDIEEEDVVVSI